MRNEEHVTKNERTRENDIRYRGPLSYRHLMILGWLCISFKVIAVLTAFGIRIDPRQPQWLYTLSSISGTASGFALPFFLLANFAVILDKKETYKQQLLKFGGLSLLTVLLFVIIKERYIVGILAAAAGEREGPNRFINELLNETAVNGMLIFNLFIDLFLCTLFMFFLEYVPKKYFQGRKLWIFRGFAVIPVLYEIGALFLRVSMATGQIKPLYIVFPFLTTKPFMSFILFVILALYIKLGELRFRKKGKSAQDYDEYTQTNLHSLRFSIFTSAMILITAFIDLILSLFGTSWLLHMKYGFDQFSIMASEAYNETLEDAVLLVKAWKIGGHFRMICLIPIVLLFSYTRNHKNPKADIYIPIGGILLAVIVAVEGIYQGLVMNIPILRNMLLRELEMLYQLFW